MRKNENRPGYKKTKVGWIPEEWKLSKACNLMDVRDGTHDTPKQCTSGVPLITQKNIVQGRLDKADSYCISEHDAALINRRSSVAVGDILISMIGTVGECARIETTPDFCIKNVGLFKSNDEQIISRYLIKYLHSTTSRRIVRQASNGGIQKFISLTGLRQLPILVPPPSEQEAIAGVLECWDKTIRSYEKKIEKKRNIKKRLMQKLLSGKQRLPGFSGEWKNVRLGKIISIAYGKDWKTVKSSNGGIPVYGTGGLMGYADKALFQPPAILLGRKGTIDTPIFIDEPFWAVDTTYAIHATADIDMVFLHNKLLTIQWYRYNEASGVPSLSRNTVQGIHITVPNRCAEQRAIASVLSAADEETTALEKKLSLLRDQKKFLLNNLVTGSIRLPEFCRDVVV